MKNIRKRDRNYKIDNIKAMLIFLVVLGHNMEPFCEGSIRSVYLFVYLFIYLFHMPLFVLCSGYFAKFSAERIKRKLLYPYALFQILYLFFEQYYYRESDYPISLLTPYWILWYLFSFILWILSLPLVEKYFEKKKGAVICIGSFFLLGVLAGFDQSIGVEFGISRTIVYYPYFLIGYAMHNCRGCDLIGKVSNRLQKGIMCLGLLLAIFWYWRENSNLRPWAVFGAYSYAESNSCWQIRAWLYVFGTLISLFFIVWMPNKKLIFSYIGQNSMQIFLLHGFILKTFRKLQIYELMDNNVLRCCFLFISTTALVLFLGSSFVKRCTSPLMAYQSRDASRLYRRLSKFLHRDEEK